MPKINKGSRNKSVNTSSRTRRRIIQLHNRDAHFARNNSNQPFNFNSLPASHRFYSFQLIFVFNFLC